MSLHDDLTRVVEDARDHSRKDFNVVKESYGQYLARAILASDVIAQVRAEALRGYPQKLAQEQMDTYGIVLPEVHEIIDGMDEEADRIEREAGLK